MKAITQVYDAVKARLAELGHAWPVLWGRRYVWQQDGELTTSGGRVVMHLGGAEDDAEVGELSPTIWDVHGDTGQNLANWWQTATVYLHGLDTTADALESERAQDDAVLGMVPAVLGALEDVLVPPVEAGRSDSHYYRFTTPRRVDRMPERFFGRVLVFEIAVNFAARRSPEREMVTNAVSVPTGVAVTPNGTVVTVDGASISP